MNKHQQSGMTTLLITSMLLIVALLFSLASYKNLFYQIKRTQNEVLARQAHWAAEGGLECGFTEISNKSDVNTSLVKCKTVVDGQLLTLSIDTDDGKSVLTSETDNKYKKIAKTIVAGGAKSSGVIKSSADLYFNGDYAFYPDPGKGIGSNNWECVLLRYLNNIFIHDNLAAGTTGKSGIGSNNLNYHKSPYDGFYSGPTDVHTCKTTLSVIDSYKTPLKTQLKSDFNADIIDESTMDLFKETFGVSRDDWMSVRSRSEFVEVDPGSDCGSKIFEVANKDKRHIWINGDCILNKTTSILVKEKAVNLNGLFLLVHNGLFSLTGVPELNAVIYHFNNDYNPVSNGINAWSLTSLDKTVLSKDKYKPTEGKLSPNEIMNKVVSYINGSIILSGSLILDTPGYVSYFNSSGVFSFDGELIDDLLAPFGKPRWVQGSWHDF
ncbi:hypothetical protein [Photobacterium carnosum]|uniref:hypothetical protein n=1 Tax=Photobacterium carnosum TaxID=2023717 RepID=UPI001E403BD4|nr:hypothetical protein [Photobacterium carnosum]MCD9528408.1 hypothetical protein [Photobacterium carnosum]